MARWEMFSIAGCDWARLASLPGATLFHSDRWARVLERGFHGAVQVLALVDDDGTLLAALPGCRLACGPVRILYGLFPKGNFAGSADAIAPHLESFRKTCEGLGIHMVRVIACEDSPVTDLPGVRRESHVRHVLDLSGKTPEGLWEGYGQGVRRQLRRAEKAGIAIRPIRREEFPQFHEMQTEMLVRNRSAGGLGPDFYEAIWDEFAPDGKAEFLVAEKDGRVVGAIVGLHGPQVTYYFAGCSRTDALEMRPNDLLMHTLIQNAIRRGSRSFDFLSSSADDEGLIRFKAKWGAEARPFDHLEWWFSTPHKWLWHTVMFVVRYRLGAALVRLARRLTERASP
jgi:hypothetical protein